ncbi:hypothetical protein pdam_00007662 [Pocillopora damicornis]|uniref:ZP domain-containing protein n=1 Tax=Pocillopora damicornis TaxID=46731 RepID=A0A3M6TZP0_POCDA|nr:hypothetical protein pdam_00007662 [Pocillopora damicornis]
MECRVLAWWIFILVLVCITTEASHFRHGSIMWAPDNSNSNKFRFRIGWRRSYSAGLYCDQSTISSNQLISFGSSWDATCTNSPNPVCGSTAIGNTNFYCTDYSTTEDWTVGENNFTHTFSNSEKEWHVRINFTITPFEGVIVKVLFDLSFSGCCWIALSHYGGSTSWRVETTINLSPRSDNGKINSSPVTRSPAIVRFPGGCRQSFRIPVEDPDGDTVKCRFATISESLRDNTSFPYGTLDETPCVLTYNGSQQAVGGIYAVALTLEDFPAGTTNFGSVTPFSGIPLQFLVMVIGNHAGNCHKKPVYTASTPKDGECSDVSIGSAYIAVIEVQVADLSKSLESEWRCVTILVGMSSTPRVILASRKPKAPVSTFGSGYSNWSVQFDRLIKKPRASSYIRLVLLPSRQTVYKVDALSQNVTIGSNSTTLRFLIPLPVLSMEGLYAILMDKGVVVGEGCSSGGTFTPGISSSSAWRFYVRGVCRFGYSLSLPDFRSCVDVNECAYASSYVHSNASARSKIFPEFILPAGCDQVCRNTQGNYSCSCASGYQLQSNGKSCKGKKQNKGALSPKFLGTRTATDSHLAPNVVTRSHDIKLPFYCRYSRKKLLSLAFTPRRIYVGNETGYGTFTFKMDFYKSSSFATPYTTQDYPLTVDLNEYVYLRYSVASSADLVIMAENCKATKDASFYSWPQYTFLQNGCPKDSTLDYSYDPTRQYQQFKIKTLRFWNDYGTVYFHCELLACHRNSPNSRCSKGCIKNKRKRRDVVRDGTEQEESTNKVILTGGPVLFEGAKEEESKEPKQGMHTALIGGVAGAGVFGLFAVVALAVLFVKYRRTQRFPNSNKDEPAGQNNAAYMPEDDVSQWEAIIKSNFA